MSDNPTTTIDLNWQNDFKFTASDAYGHEITVDAPQNNGDEFDGFKPGELFLTSLAGCSSIDVVNILKKQRHQVTGIDVKVTGEQEPEAPWTWTKVHLDYTIRGRGLKPVPVERAIHLSENKYCSVGATIGGRCRVSSSFQIVEEGDAAA